MVITAVNNLPPVKNKTQGLISSNLPFQGLISPKIDTQQAVVIPPYSGDFTSVPLPSQPNGITTVIVNGQILTGIIDNRFNSNNLPSINNPLPIGTFWYDYKNQRLYIAPKSNASGLSVIYNNPSVELVKSTRITDFPDFFYLFNVVGTFTIERSFQGHPTAKLTITDDYETKYEQILNYFQKGRDFIIRGIGFEADNPQTELELNQRTGKMVCTVNFRGKWEGSPDYIATNLDKPIPEADLIKESKRDYYTISQAAGRAGVPFSGSSRKIYLSIPVPVGKSIEFRSLLDNRQFYPDGKIIDWENPTQIKLRSWEQMPTLVLPDNLENLGITPGDKTKLTNRVLTLEKPNKGKGDVYQTITEGRLDYQSPPNIPKSGYYEAFSVEALRTPSWCFDITSEKTIPRTIKQLNGLDLEIIEEEWGFVYTTIDVYEISGNRYVFNPSSFDSSPDNLWQRVRITTKVYNYDPKTGYLVSVRGSTQRLTRLKQETAEGMESINLQLAIAQEDDENTIFLLTKRLTAYTDFFWVTEPYNEDYSNDDLSRYYPELGREDNDRIPPQYVKEFKVGQGVITTKPNPESTLDEPLPPVILGEIKKQTVTTFITDTNKRKYKEKQDLFTVKGYGVEDSIGSTDSQDKNGIPSTATRLQKLGFTEENSENEGEITLKYLIATDGGFLPDNIENGTIDYPGITTLVEGIKGIRTEYSIINSQKEEVLTISTKTPLDVIMGQNIIKDGVIYRLFSYSENYKVSGVVNCESVELTLGKYQEVTVRSRKL